MERDEPPAEWVIMFVDLVGSTALKYREEPADVASALLKVLRILRQQDAANVRFSGDGAMLLFRRNPDGCRKALDASEQIFQLVDRLNLEFSFPRLELRIGIATGECFELSHPPAFDVIGKYADLAARLCAETRPNTILVDRLTKQESHLEPRKFSRCDLRLPLKGVPAAVASKQGDEFYFFEPERLIANRVHDGFSHGLLSLYPNRAALASEFPPTRILWLAQPETSILLAGRTLISWTKLRDELESKATEKKLTVNFLIGHESITEHLDDEQSIDVKHDLLKARPFLFKLAQKNPSRFRVRETRLLLLDGISCVTVRMPGPLHPPDLISSRLIVAHDVNAAGGDGKAALLFACTCGKFHPRESCMAHGLLDRTQLIFERAQEIRNA
jgi:class 3 adenylate cyclase